MSILSFSMIVFATASLLSIQSTSGQSVLVNFDVYPDGSAVQSGDTFTTQYAGVGVVFSEGQGGGGGGGSGGVGPSGNHCSVSPPNHAAANGLIVATFVDPCSGAASATNAASLVQDFCWAPGEGLDVYAFDLKGNQIGHQFVAGGGTAASFGFDSPIIARLDIYHIGQGIDNLSFTVPASVFNPCPTDANDDDAVNVDDLLAVINSWGACGLGICEGDIDCDDSVNVDDLLSVINAWGTCR